MKTLNDVYAELGAAWDKARADGDRDALRGLSLAEKIVRDAIEHNGALRDADIAARAAALGMEVSQ